MTVDHPLHPVTAAEIEQAVAIYRASSHAGEKTAFVTSQLLEPAKDEVLQHRPGDGFARVIRLMGTDEAPDGGFVADVDVTRDAVVGFARRDPGAQVPFGYGDMEAAIILTKTNPDWLAAVQSRGISNIELVQVDPWPGSGYPHAAIPEGHRCVRCIAFVREDETDNGYARPIQGLIAHVDLTEGKVAAVEDTGAVPMPPLSGRYTVPAEQRRTDLRPLDITQPEGPSWTIDGYHVAWQGWEFRISMHPVQGLVLHQISLHGRPVLYRASLSEMVVPYGDKDGMHSWKHVMDASEYAMGMLVNSLTLGCDCLGEIHYFDVHQVNWKGEVKTVEQAICMHEEDYGIQWKHYDAHAQTTEVRRSRRLVVSSIHTVGNYDYGFYWYLYLDGTIQMEVKLTGIVGVSAVTADNVNPAQAPLISEGLASPVHQHLFCFRLDWALDGGANSLFENQVEALPVDDDNPTGTQFRSVSRHLRTEEEARRLIAPQASRYWKVVNPGKTNSWGQPVGYKLLPAATPTLLASPDSVVGKRAAFARYNLWATPYTADETAAAGTWTVMQDGHDGLAHYTRDNRDISECDLVTWYTTGVTHVPRPEDWPVMPVEYCGFHLIPVGFFDRNPTLDLPAHCHT